MVARGHDVNATADGSRGALIRGAVSSADGCAVPAQRLSAILKISQKRQNVHCWMSFDVWQTPFGLQWPSWKLKKLRTAAEAGNYFRDREYGRPVEGLIVTEDGHCADEMNRNIWCECCCACVRLCARSSGSGTLVS